MNRDINMLREYRQGDEYAITTLFHSSDPRHSRSVYYWHWSNDENYLNDYISVVAEDKTEIIGHYSLSGCEIHYGGETRRIGFGQQAVIHKKYRNLQTIVELNKLIYQYAADKYDFIYAFPNDNMYPINIKLLNWNEVNVFNADVIYIDKIAHLGNSRLKVDIIKWFPPEVDGIISCNSGKIDFMKSSLFLNWRFFKHPINHYTVFGAYDKQDHIVSYIVLKLYFDTAQKKMVGHFLDYEAVDYEALSAVINASVKFFIFHNVEKIIFWNKNKSYESLFNEYIEDNESGFKTNFGILNLKDHRIPCQDINSWSFSMAFSDAF